MDAMEWLGAWEDLGAPGRHCRICPAEGAFGYPIPKSCYGSRAPKPPEGPVYSMWDRVNRAIPVDGAVGDDPPSWTRSPQARFWLEPEKKSLRQRFREWLRKS